MTSEKPLTRTLDDLLAAYERVLIMETLRRNGWNRRKSAAALGIPLRRFFWRLSMLHVDLEAIPHDKRGRRQGSVSLGA